MESQPQDFHEKKKKNLKYEDVTLEIKNKQ